MQDIAIVIVAHNSWKHLPKCLDSLEYAINNMEAEVFVVDNASTDGTYNNIKKHYPWCNLILCKINGGYSRGNNFGLKEAGFPNSTKFRHALLLNPDTELPENALQELLTYMDSQTDIGVLGPKLVLSNGKLDKACKRGLPTPAAAFYHLSGIAKMFPKSRIFGRYNMSYIDEDEIADVDSTVGACQLIRGEALAKTGLMDESFFMYGEDIDINLRIKQLGYRIVYYPQVIIKHHKGTSTRQTPDAMIRAFYGAMKLFHAKHFASQHSVITNMMIYGTINFICQYKLFRNSMKPSHKRVVGSAPE
jgi:GT2 family glycosyltransferase